MRFPEQSKPPVCPEGNPSCHRTGEATTAEACQRELSKLGYDTKAILNRLDELADQCSAHGCHEQCAAIRLVQQRIRHANRFPRSR